MNSPIINITAATQMQGYKLKLEFDDGVAREVDFKPFLTQAIHPDIRAYLEPARFADFRVEYGELVWGDYALCFPMMDLYAGRIEKRSTLQAAA